MPRLRSEPVLAALMALAALYGWALFVSTFVKPGSIGPNFNAPGTDWMVFHAAARATLDGHIAGIFDGDKFTAFLNGQYKNWLTSALPFRPWVYPPSFLLLVLPFGMMGFFTAYLLFQAITGGALVAALRAGELKAGTIAAVLLSPAAAISVIDGQLAFMIAAILAGGFFLLERRPWIAGAILGLLTLKPQFALMAPLALIAGGSWRAFAAAALSATVLVLASALALGIEPWIWWWHQTLSSIASPDPKWIEFGRIWGNSVYACALLLGADNRMASLLQAIAVVVCAGVVIAAYRSRMNRDLKLAVLLVATILAAPHSGAYDALLLVIAGFLWIARTAGEAWRWMIVLALWIVPIISPPAVIPPGRVIPFLLIALIAIVFTEHFSVARKLPREMPVS